MKNAMRADQVAQLAVALCSDKAKDTNGQIFAVRGNEVFLFNQPRPVRALGMLEGWTPASLLEQAAKEVGDVFTNQRKLDAKLTGVNLVVSAEDAAL